MPMSEASLIQQSIQALQSGDKATAVTLLTQALRADRNNEQAWLYLGIALDDPARKRQAFEQVLKLDPTNEKAQQMLNRLNSAPSADSDAEATVRSRAVPPLSTAEPAQPQNPKANGRFNQVLNQVRQLLTRPIKTPLKLEGAPRYVTISGIFNKSFRIVTRSYPWLSARQYPSMLESAANTTVWDTQFSLFAAGLVFASAEFIGLLIRGIIGLNLGRIIVTPVVAALIALMVVVIALWGGAYIGQLYLESKHITVRQNQFLFYIATPFVVVIAIESVMVLGSQVVGLSFLSWLTGITSFALTAYVAYLAREPIQSAYQLKDDDCWTVVGLSFASVWVIMHLLLAVFGFLFRIPFM